MTTETRNVSRRGELRWKFMMGPPFADRAQLHDANLTLANITTVMAGLVPAIHVFFVIVRLDRAIQSRRGDNWNLAYVENRGWPGQARP